LHEVDDSKILLMAVVCDDNPPTERWGLKSVKGFTNGWVAVRNFTFNDSLKVPSQTSHTLTFLQINNNKNTLTGQAPPGEHCHPAGMDLQNHLQTEYRRQG
jgi:hypothetical protein